MQKNDRRSGPRSKVFVPVGKQLRAADLVFEAEQPVVVLSWQWHGTDREPVLAIPLDRLHLRPIPDRRREYIYTSTDLWIATGTNVTA